MQATTEFTKRNPTNKDVEDSFPGVFFRFPQKFLPLNLPGFQVDLFDVKDAKRDPMKGHEYRQCGSNLGLKSSGSVLLKWKTFIIYKYDL